MYFTIFLNTVNYLDAFVYYTPILFFLAKSIDLVCYTERPHKFSLTTDIGDGMPAIITTLFIEIF